MKNRKKYLKARKKQFRWQQIGMFSDKKCSKCGQNTLIQIYKHDAWACIACNEWHDEACNFPKCPFCSNRPQTPYEVYWSIDRELDSAIQKKNWRRLNYQHKKNGERKHKWKENYSNNYEIMKR